MSKSLQSVYIDYIYYNIGGTSAVCKYRTKINVDATVCI
jgi:hypothetical protein